MSIMDIPTTLSESIKDEYRCISVKINYGVGEYDENNKETPPDEFHSVKSYFIDNKLDIIYSSLGLHLNGENKKPHSHWHLIVRELPTGTFQSNSSQHRKRWLAKEGNETHSFENVSIRFPKQQDPVWQILAYPFKEGHVQPTGNARLKPYLGFLVEYAINLYQVSLGNRARAEACDERKKVALQSLGKLCSDNQSSFTNYREMVIWLDINYIDLLPLEEKPDPRNYKANCQKVCVQLGKLKYSDII